AWKNILRGFDNSTVGQSGRRNVVRYDSPSFGGFSVAAAWGEDDLWDAALTYKGDVGDFALTGKAGYGEGTDESKTGTACGGPAPGFECKWAGASGTIMHKPSGLYVYGGYGWQKIDTPLFTGDDTSTTWVIQPGIEKKWMPLGKTTVFGEYRHDDPGANGLSGADASFGGNINFWAGGVVQNIEAAAADLYLIYRHADGDYKPSAATSVSLDGFDAVLGGMLIQF
ncbi:MAG: porin, partial [Terriglobia bacterium]